MIYPTNCELYKPIVDRYSWDSTIAMAVMQAESSCYPYASHVDGDGTVDTGLFQVNSVHGFSDLDDPSVNIADAYKVYSDSGWNAWTTYKSGKYLRYLR